MSTAAPSGRGRLKATIEEEQNRAAGGAHRRLVRLADGPSVKGTIALHRSAGKTGFIAHLRWRTGGKSISRSLGVVPVTNRLRCLSAAWNLARDRGLVHDEELPISSWASSPEVRASMRANRSRDTRPELRLRKLLHARGLRYRVSARPLPTLARTADILFTKAKIAVFIDGCYWHGCKEHYRAPSKNSAFWREKIASNKRRDDDTNQLLNEAGWTVIRHWEHERIEEVADDVVATLGQRSPNRDHPKVPDA